MKLVRKTLGILLVVILTAPIFGCGVGTTAADNRRVLARIAEYDSRMLVDDVALLIQTNRPIRTSSMVID